MERKNLKLSVSISGLERVMDYKRVKKKRVLRRSQEVELVHEKKDNIMRSTK